MFGKQTYDKVAHNLGFWPQATYHVMERLPRLFVLLKTLPEVSMPLP
jgi:hypothetical protein